MPPTASNQYATLHVAHLAGLAASVHVKHLLAAVQAEHTLAPVTLRYPSEQVSHSSALVHALQPTALHGQALPASFVPS